MIVPNLLTTKAQDHPGPSHVGSALARDPVRTVSFYLHRQQAAFLHGCSRSQTAWFCVSDVGSALARDPVLLASISLQWQGSRAGG